MASDAERMCRHQVVRFLLQSVQFSDLSAEEARLRFTEFVGLWNAVRLPARLYAGVDGGSLRRTQHSWGRLAGELPAWMHTRICKDVYPQAYITAHIHATVIHSCVLQRRKVCKFLLLPVCFSFSTVYSRAPRACVKG